MNKEVKEICLKCEHNIHCQGKGCAFRSLSNDYCDEVENANNLIKNLQQKVNQLENKYNKALELLVDFNLPCEQQMFMDRYSEWCELNCSVSDECYKKCWNKYIEAELEKSKSE